MLDQAEGNRVKHNLALNALARLPCVLRFDVERVGAIDDYEIPTFGYDRRAERIRVVRFDEIVDG